MASTKPPQILLLNPSSDIIFEGPFEQVVTSYLELRNPSQEKVCFKVKTTAPRRYCVRPNSGIVEPSGKVRIAIMLQPIEQDNQAERSKHKFMVQSTIMRENVSLETVWSLATPDDIMDSKLRCVFQTPSSTTAPAAATTTTTTTTTSSSWTPDLLAQGTASATTTTIGTSEQRQAKGSNSESAVINQSRAAELPGDSKITSSTSARANKQAEAYSRSTPATSTAPTASGDSTPKRSTNYQQDLNKSAASSSHNLTTSFLQPMSDDYKLVIVSLAMLIIGVILGKYII